MEREETIKDIGYVIEIGTEYGYSDEPYYITELIDRLKESVDKGATHVMIIGNIYDGCLEDVDIQPCKVEIESEEDYEKRIRTEESRRLAAENVAKAREKALYEELKAKYGD